MLHDFLFNFTHNLFKPLLLFFYMGFEVSLLKVPRDLPKAIYKSLTIYRLFSIGWLGGEELARALLTQGDYLAQVRSNRSVGKDADQWRRSLATGRRPVLCRVSWISWSLVTNWRRSVISA